MGKKKNYFYEAEKLREGISQNLSDAMPEIEQKIWIEIYKMLENFDLSGGKFVYSEASPKRIIEIENKILNELTRAGYYNRVDLFLKDFGKITDNVRAIHEGENKIQVSKDSLTKTEKLFSKQTAQQLKESGLNETFITPVKTAINEAVTFGYSLSNTREVLQEMIVGGPKKLGLLNNYLTTTSREVVKNLQGAQHTQIKNSLGLDNLRYVGGLLKDSRGQCVRWCGMEYIPYAELDKEIKLAFKNQAAKLEQPEGHKWSGMIKDTTVDNFLMRLGGWGCMHSAIPTRKKASTPSGNNNGVADNPIVKTSEFTPQETVNQAKDYVKGLAQTKADLNISNVSVSRELKLADLNDRIKQVQSLFDEYKAAQAIGDGPVTISFNSTKRSFGYVKAQNYKWEELKEINFGHRYADREARVDEPILSVMREKSKVDESNLHISTVTHEFAHLIAVNQQSKLSGDIERFFAELRRVKNEYHDELSRASMIGDFATMRSISLGKYASTNINEFMAEAFTEYKLSSKPGKYAKFVGQLIDKYFKR